MASPTLRAALSPLDVNKSTTCRDPNFGSKGVARGSEEQVQVAADASLQKKSHQDVSGTVPEKSPAGNTKRGSIVVEDFQEQSPKRRKTDGDSVRVFASEEMSKVELGTEDRANAGQSVQPRGFESPRSVHAPSTLSDSPSSTFSLSNNELNDSQNTILTEPDDLHHAVTRTQLTPPALSTRMSPEEIRRRAREMKLRLSLASYKVRTNQIDVPISRLQIRSFSADPKMPSFVRTTSSSSLCRAPLHPNAVSSIPNISVQEPSAEKKQEYTTINSSPPPSYREQAASLDKGAGETREAFATPLLPRQRQGLLNPPALESPTWEDRRSAGNDLTSSVVKGRAADGLLSLMRHQS